MGPLIGSNYGEHINNDDDHNNLDKIVVYLLTVIYIAEIPMLSPNLIKLFS